MCHRAGNTTWGSAVKEYYCVDESTEMNDMARQMLALSESPY